MNLHTRIRDIRKSRRLTQGYCASVAGISVAAWSHYERGRRTPPTATLAAIARALNCTVGDLFVEARRVTCPHCGGAGFAEETNDG